jgi:dTDP-4-amino-4,6-dideoxygalactose transaminase
MVGAVDSNTTPAPRIPFHRPLLPRAEALLPYLRQIDAQKIYTNQGPLYRAFQRRLALRWQPGSHCVPVASGTAGIVLALLATGAWRPGLCLVPAWSFRATWNAVRLAGLVPVPVDVSADSWQLEPDAAEAVASKLGQRVASVVAVSPFGAPVDPSRWEAFRRRTGIHVVIDAAGAFDRQAASSIPTVISLSATKILGVGEGGIVLVDGPELATRIEIFAGNGVRAGEAAHGMNAKLSEYHCAVGLAALDEYEAARREFSAAASRYLSRLGAAAGRVIMQAGFGSDWLSASLCCAFPSTTAPKLIAGLAARDIECRAWWPQILRPDPRLTELGAPSELPVAEWMQAHAVGVPFYRTLGDEGIDRVSCALLECAGGIRTLAA